MPALAVVARKNVCDYCWYPLGVSDLAGERVGVAGVDAAVVSE